MQRRLFVVMLVVAVHVRLLPADQDRTSFEVASIKRHPEPITFSSDPSIRGARMIGTAVTLVDLIVSAYGIQYDQVAGAPAWASSEHYDINAKAEGAGTIGKEEGRRMLQNLLAERFQLKIHRETKETSVFALVVSKNGPKVKPSPADASGNNFVRASASGMHMEANKGTMEQLARQLTSSAGRRVVDKTELTGYYKYTLDWISGNPPAEANPDTPPLPTALQEQLGLKLEPAKGTIEMLIIDRAEKPSDN